MQQRKEWQRAEKAEGVALAAQDDVEQALARSLVRPLNWKGGDPRSDPEAEALWELAQRPGGRLWRRFVEEAVRTPLTASQLSGRAEPALIAAVGLDPEKRQRVQERLVKRLEAADVSGRQRLDLAIAVRILGDLVPASSRRERSRVRKAGLGVMSVAA